MWILWKEQNHRAFEDLSLVSQLQKLLIRTSMHEVLPIAILMVILKSRYFCT